jgi:hypothetical protein
LTAKRCAAWTPNGDLLISEAKRIAREHNITEDDGARRLASVYAVLDSAPVAGDVLTGVVVMADGDDGAGMRTTTLQPTAAAGQVGHGVGVVVGVVVR